ncbi:hypothetical protein M0R45_006079 [Rubus argutus]|uniref:Uncharacterized protein n=1 Tax=Rubus argutus TaxID=59490 RepID=A0AAW1YPE1_RUBAR
MPKFASTNGAVCGKVERIAPYPPPPPGRISKLAIFGWGVSFSPFIIPLSTYVYFFIFYINMEAYDSEQDLELEHDLEPDHKVLSDQDMDSEEELRDVSPDTPYKKSQSRPQKSKKKVQRMKSLKGQLGTFSRILEDIQAQLTVINQKSESQMISTERLTQQMEDVNQELLAQGEKTQHIEDSLLKSKKYRDPPKPEEEVDADDEQTTESDEDESNGDGWYSGEEQRQHELKNMKRRTLKPQAKGELRRRVVKTKPTVPMPLTAEAMSALIKQTVAGEFGIMHQRIDQMDKGKLPYIPDLGSEELPLPYTEAIMLGKTSKSIKF